MKNLTLIFNNDQNISEKNYLSFDNIFKEIIGYKIL